MKNPRRGGDFFRAGGPRPPRRGAVDQSFCACMKSSKPASGEQSKQSSDDDAMKRLLESMQGDKEKKP